MKFTATGILFMALTSSAFAQAVQNPDPSKWMCRNLVDSGGFVYQGETIFGSQACRPILQAPVDTRQVTTRSNQAPTTQPAATSAASEPSPTLGGPAAALPVAPVGTPNSPKPKAANPSGEATVVLYRPSRFIDAARKATIYVDNRPLCILTNNTSLRFEIPTGVHSLGTLFNRQTKGETALPSSEFNFVAGQTYYFTLTKNWLIFAVSTQQGESESRRTKPLNEGNISVQPSGNELN
jgi:hypothetical protein